MGNALQAAIQLLARREHAASELLKKLEARGYTRLASEEALLHCQTQGLQSDERFAGAICRTRVSQGYGKLNIQLELKKWGIAPHIIERIFLEESVDWCGVAAQLLHKHRWRFNSSNTIKKQRFLMSRGFSFDVIQAVLRETNVYENR